MSQPNQVYLQDRSHAIGLYVDQAGFSVALLQINKVLIPLQRPDQPLIIRAQVEYAEAIRYQLTKAINHNTRTKLSIKEICISIESMIGECEEDIPTLYYNPSRMMDKLLENQAYEAVLQPVQVIPSEMITLINCLLNDRVLTISPIDGLATTYRTELQNYSDMTTVNHALFSLGLSLECFESGDATWIKSLSNIDLAEDV